MILNYAVTSNHVHLLVLDEISRDVIPQSIKLVAGRTAQEYNVRKNRKGAFWEDRYHATAVESEHHLLRCLVYLPKYGSSRWSPIPPSGLSVAMERFRSHVENRC